MTSGMDNGGGQRKPLTNSPRGRIHSHSNLAISLTLRKRAGQLKHKSERLKPAKHQCFSPPTSHPSACAQPPADKGQSISSHKPRSQVLQKEGKPCFGALTGNQQGALKDRNNAVSQTHRGQHQTSPAQGCSSTSGLPLVSLPGTTHHRALGLACLVSFLTPRRNRGRNSSLWKFQTPLKSRLPCGYTTQSPLLHPASDSRRQRSHSQR